MPKQFYRFVTNEAGSSELYLEGVIASESWYDDEVSPKQFRDELDKVSGAITVRINSPGGDVFAGMQIYNMLKDRNGDVTVIVDALAASAASFIAMAGDKIIMNTGSMMMVHKASTIAWGNEDEMQQVIEMLRKTDDSIISVYAARTGKSKEEIKQLLADETWMTAEEAVEMGFADEATAGKTSLSDSVKNALSFTKEVQNAAMQPVMSLTKKLKNETEEVAEVEEIEVEETETEEAEVTEVEETETVEDVVVEDTETEIKDSTEKEQTQMSEIQDAATTQVIEPAAQAPVATAPKKSFKDYIKSPKAVEDFANVLAANPGNQDSESVAKVKAAWKEIVVKNGLDPDSANYFVLPTPLVTKIEDAVKASGIYNALNHTGLDVARVDWDATDPDADTSRAGGHTKGDTKQEQILDFQNRIIRAQYIYKYLTLNKEDVRQQRSTGALINFVMNELPTRVIREIERAVVIGDGRLVSDDRKIREDATNGGFTPILVDAEANNSFAVEYTPEAGETKSVSLVKAIDNIEVEGDVYLIAKKGYLTDIRLEFIANGVAVIPPSKETVAASLNLAGVFEPKWFNDTTSPDHDAILVVLGAYKTVGDASVESFTNFVLKENKYEYLAEIFKGGALASAGVAAVAILTEAS